VKFKWEGRKEEDKSKTPQKKTDRRRDLSVGTNTNRVEKKDGAEATGDPKGGVLRWAQRGREKEERENACARHHSSDVRSGAGVRQLRTDQKKKANLGATHRKHTEKQRMKTREKKSKVRPS